MNRDTEKTLLLSEMAHSQEEVLARVVNQTIIKDRNFAETNHVTIHQFPHPDYPPATTPFARREIETSIAAGAKEDIRDFLSKPSYSEITVITRSMNASPFLHHGDKVWGIIKTNDENKPVAIDVIGGCGPDESIPEVLDREGFSEEAVMYHKRTGKFLLPQNGHDMSIPTNYLKNNAVHHLRHNGYVPEPFPAVLEQLLSSSDDQLIQPIPHNTTSENMKNWLDTNLLKATVILENVKGEQAEPVECYVNIHDEGSDAIVPFHTPPPEDLAVVDLEWVTNEKGVSFATRRDYVFLPISDWQRLATGKNIENAYVLRNGIQELVNFYLPLKSLAFSLFSPTAHQAV